MEKEKKNCRASVVEGTLGDKEEEEGTAYDRSSRVLKSSSHEGGRGRILGLLPAAVA